MVKPYFSPDFCYNLDFLQFKPEEIIDMARAIIEKNEIEQIKNKVKELGNYDILLEEEHYLSILLKLLQNSKNTNSENVERIFQAIAIICFKPKFLFGSNKPWKQEGSKSQAYRTEDYSAYNQFIKQFYFNLEKYQQELKLCWKYISRGTTKHNVERLTLDSELYQTLENEINACFKKYYYQLKANGIEPHTYDPPKVYSKAEVDDANRDKTKLLQKCFEREWLFPISHVLLVRHAQYQLMGYKKYKAENLLEASSKSFTPIKNENQKEILTLLTIDLAQELKVVIDKLIGPTHITNISRIFYKQLIAERRQKKDKNSLFLNPIQMLNPMCLEDLNSFPLCVPNFDTDVLAVKLATKLDLNDNQMKILSDILFDLLWSRVDIEKKLHDVNYSTDKTEIQKIANAIKAIREFLNPKNYFIVDEELALNNLAPAYKKLVKCGLFKKIEKPITLGLISKQTSSFFYLTDLTLMTLWISNSLQYHHSMNSTLPNFLNSCLEALEKNLDDYTKSKHICWYMGIDKLSSEEKQNLKTNSQLRTLRDEITKQMTWEIAEQFLKENLIDVYSIEEPASRNKRQIDKIKIQWRHLISSLGGDESFKKLVYYTAFSQILEESLHLLESKVKEVLILLSQSLIVEFSHGGESL